VLRFYGEEHLAQPPKLEDHPLSAVRDCIFNILAAILHIGGRFSIHNLRTRHAVVTGTHFSRQGKGQLAGTRECGNEPSGSIKCGEFLN